MKRLGDSFYIPAGVGRPRLKVLNLASKDGIAVVVAPGAFTHLAAVEAEALA
jgi:hypothetical protein